MEERDKHARKTYTPEEVKSKNIGRLEFIIKELENDAGATTISFDVMLSALRDVEHYLSQRRMMSLEENSHDEPKNYLGSHVLKRRG